MKKVSIFAAAFLFIFTFGLTAFAQAPGTKIGVINTELFYADKGGITRLLAAYSALEKEFAPRQQELNTMNTRLTALAKEIEAMQDQLNKPTSQPPVDLTTVRSNMNAKNEEGQRLQVDMKRKQEDAKAAYEKREAAVAGPIKREIGLAIDEFAKTKGLSMVIDGAKMVDSGILLSLDKTMDLTDDFIKFFNAKPAPAVTK